MEGAPRRREVPLLTLSENRSRTARERGVPWLDAR
jgi:hypothetical protein